LRQLCGGLELGADLQAQQALLQATAAECHTMLDTLRLRCTAAVMAELQEDLGRFHPRCVRLAHPLPGDPWLPAASQWCCLQADLGSSHPYPLELDLPPWVISGSQELQRWFFSWGAGLQIESPLSLQVERQRWLQAHQLLGGDKSCTVMQTRAAARIPAVTERKQMRIRKRIAPRMLDRSKSQ
jgi:hypothetical protein